MHALLLLASITGASASFNLADTIFHANNISPNNQVRQIAGDDERQATLPFQPLATLSDTDCISAIMSLDRTMPTPPPELVGYMDEDFCITDLPDSLTANSSSFTSNWASWTSANSDLVESAKEECPDATKVIDLVLNMCAETDAIEAFHDAAPRSSVVLTGAVLAALGAVVVAL